MNNKLYRGSYRELMHTIKDEEIDLIVTDPPYRVSSRGSHGNAGGMLKKSSVRSGRMFVEIPEPAEYAQSFFRVLKDGAHCYVMTNHINLISMLNAFTSCGFKFIKCLIWDKGNKIMGQWYMSQFEYILFFRKGRAVRINDCGTSDILSVPNKKHKRANGENWHDTEKPVTLMKILVSNSSRVGDVVLDPFFGVGGSAVAAMELDRVFIGSEIEEDYFKIAQDRVKKYMRNIEIDFSRCRVLEIEFKEE